MQRILSSFFSLFFAGSFSWSLSGAGEEKTGPVKVRPGPWGNLEYHTLALEPPDVIVQNLYRTADWPNGTIWRFETRDIRSLLLECGLDREQVDRLEKDGVIRSEAGLCEIRPPDDLIESLSEEQRVALYPKMLSKGSTAYFTKPFHLRRGGIRSIPAAAANLPAGQLDLIEQLTYRVNRSPLVSDIPYLLKRAESDEVRRNTLKLMAREFSLCVRLRLGPGSDHAALADYWGADGRNSAVLALLESVVRRSGIDELDLVHLLPPLPRKQLHTYPSLSGPALPDDFPDCFTTAMSFFSEELPDRYLDFVGHVFSERYEPVEKPLQLGDVILLRDPGTGRWVHACNHIAADLAFTKNGESLSRPWAIETLHEIVSNYSDRPDLEITFHRLKPGFRR